MEPIAKTVCPDLPDEVTTLPQAFSELSSFTASQSNRFIQEHAARAPHTNKQVITRVNETPKAWSLVVSQWDKKLHRLGGFCISLLESHTVQGILLAPEFDIVGVAPSRWQCNAMGLTMLLRSAHRHKILELGSHLGLLSEKLQHPLYRQQFIARHYVPVDLWDIMPFKMHDISTAPHKRYAVPSIFALPKWKLDKVVNYYIWRNIITFAPHPLKPLARTVGRCLTLMVKECIKAVPFMALPSLLGVRDMFMGLVGLDAGRNCTFVRERDMDNCYWNIDKREALQALTAAKEKIMNSLGQRITLWFSIARGNDRHRDRIGKSAEHMFVVLNFDEVYEYVVWDLLHNTFFCLDTILLRQGSRGVPIGGFLSAQIMVLWAIFRESVLFNQEGMQAHMRNVHQALCGMGMPACSYTPGPQLTFPQDVVLPRNRAFFKEYGMRGWFNQQFKTLGWIRLGEINFRLLLLGLWDSYPSGRFGHIIAAAPKKARPMLNAHFETLCPRDVMLAETTYFRGCLPDSSPDIPPEPTVLFSRFMDNNYIGYVHIPPGLPRQQVVRFTQVFIDVLYNIPMKWEPCGAVNDWCESRVVTEPELILLMKNVCFQLPDTSCPQTLTCGTSGLIMTPPMLGQS